ncbi:hypothetical protein ASPWEDRAFT_689986 [Aspergillus wentii DTO 134E9]|uniref:Uncharacterized protein n=1 Tax=Aspergillus wentii DTO 134E9 TaxID=1073089 RepID=A0A1L9R8U9_ASPWE|nr:uncharacterized protein ASPWEDRAFT_689986 [Aspergillus wentii DTO 134E9]OJJ31313.1 hypothetical protein ASPWEDRAFT_689986 [Aspergillus wentii DTO 134E9]
MKISSIDTCSFLTKVIPVLSPIQSSNISAARNIPKEHAILGHIERYPNTIIQIAHQDSRFHIGLSSASRLIALTELPVGGDPRSVQYTVPFRRTFRRPIELVPLFIHCNSHTPPATVIPLVWITSATEYLNIAAIDIRSHHFHSFTVTPIQLSRSRGNLQLYEYEPRSRKYRISVTVMMIGLCDVWLEMELRKLKVEIRDTAGNGLLMYMSRFIGGPINRCNRNDAEISVFYAGCDAWRSGRNFISTSVIPVFDAYFI